MLNQGEKKKLGLCCVNMLILVLYCQSQWLRGLRCRSAAACLLGLWVRIPPGAWIFVSCECCVLSGRGLCSELITYPEESYRLWCVMCDLETSWMRRPWPNGGCRTKNKHWCCTVLCMFNVVIYRIVTLGGFKINVTVLCDSAIFLVSDWLNNFISLWGHSQFWNVSSFLFSGTSWSRFCQIWNLMNVFCVYMSTWKDWEKIWTMGECPCLCWSLQSSWPRIQKSMQTRRVCLMCKWHSDSMNTVGGS